MSRDIKKFPVAMRFGVTPVPIPNTTVKTKAAESTILATVWEDRWLPGPKKIKRGFTRVDFLVVLASIYARAELHYCKIRLDGDHMAEDFCQLMTA